ncbi:MAG: ATP-binding protein [Gemmatimonadaceae bacterium]
MSEPRVVVDLDIPSDVSQIERVVSLVTDVCRDLRLPKRKYTLNVPVALSEALSNAIIRDNREDPSKHVHVRATVSDLALVLDVSDEGAGFDMHNVDHDPTAAEHIEREDGRGIFLMQQLMDRVEQINGSRHLLRLTLNR